MLKLNPLRTRGLAGSCGALAVACGLFMASPAHATSTISIEAPPAVLPGQTFSFLVRISGIEPIGGYDLEVLINPMGGAIGSLTGDSALSNLYPSENIIEQGGGGLTGVEVDSLLPANPGLMFQALDQTFTATAIPGAGQDVLAQVFMTASGDALGEFEISLGEETKLITENAEVEDHVSAMVTVQIPEPGYLGILSGLSMYFLHRRRQA